MDKLAHNAAYLNIGRGYIVTKSWIRGGVGGQFNGKAY